MPINKKLPGFFYHKFAFSRKVTITHADEGVVVFSPSKSCAMNIGRKETDRGKDARVKRSLPGVNVMRVI